MSCYNNYIMCILTNRLYYYCCISCGRSQKRKMLYCTISRARTILVNKIVNTEQRLTIIIIITMEHVVYTTQFLCDRSCPAYSPLFVCLHVILRIDLSRWIMVLALLDMFHCLWWQEHSNLRPCDALTACSWNLIARYSSNFDVDLHESRLHS